MPSKKNEKKKIIGFYGKAQSGKSTAVLMLSGILDDKKLEELSFAAPLKESCKIIFGLTDNQLYGDEKEDPLTNWPNWTPRKILQHVGTELFRNHFDKDIWLKIARNKIKESSADIILISDARFYNEVKLIRKMGGIVIKINRDSAGSKTGAGHSSEQFDGIKPDHIIDNNGTMQEFREKIKDTVYDYMYWHNTDEKN